MSSSAPNLWGLDCRKPKLKQIPHSRCSDDHEGGHGGLRGFDWKDETERHQNSQKTRISNKFCRNRSRMRKNNNKCQNLYLCLWFWGGFPKWAPGSPKVRSQFGPSSVPGRSQPVLGRFLVQKSPNNVNFCTRKRPKSGPNSVPIRSQPGPLKLTTCLLFLVPVSANKVCFLSNLPKNA